MTSLYCIALYCIVQLKAERLRKNKDHSRLLLGTKKEIAPPVDFCSTNISTFKVIGTSSW